MTRCPKSMVPSELRFGPISAAARTRVGFMDQESVGSYPMAPQRTSLRAGWGWSSGFMFRSRDYTNDGAEGQVLPRIMLSNGISVVAPDMVFSCILGWFIKGESMSQIPSLLRLGIQAQGGTKPCLCLGWRSSGQYGSIISIWTDLCFFLPPANSGLILIFFFYFLEM